MKSFFAIAGALLVVGACNRTSSAPTAPATVRPNAGALPTPRAGPPEPAAVDRPRRQPLPVIRLRPEDEEAVDRAARAAVASGAVPGCVIALGRADGLVFRRAYGARAIEPDREPMSWNTIFDLASITKVVATTTSVMMLIERGELTLQTRASVVIPEFRGGGREQITIEQLLTHAAGLPAVNSMRDYEGDRRDIVERIMRTPLESRPGTRVRYSDLSFLVLGEVVARRSGRPFEEFTREMIFEPLGMRETRFVPPAEWRSRIAPTERAADRGNVIIRGEVHDPRAWRLGGIAGNAGLFSTASDLSRFARALLNGGELDGVRILREDTVRAMIRPRRLRSPPHTSRALGWEVGHPHMSARAFGHTGFTGTSLWIDPAAHAFMIVLSNQVHPNGRTQLPDVREAIGALVIGAVRRSDALRATPVLNGIDVLERDGFAAIEGQRIALLTHRAARTRDGRRTLDVLHAASGVRVVRALAPEHGLGADREGHVGNGVDAWTGVPVLGLFGRSRTPTAAMLDGIDAVVIDLQDVGVRFYTYASTVRRVLEAAARRELPVILLDRPDPLGGGAPRGPVSEPALASFVNHHPLPTIHGLTLGELSTLLNAERGIGADLRVVPLEGWNRVPWRDTGLRWVPPSPNLREPEQVALYPAVALIEGTNVSVGRGTPTPFEVVGAPWVDSHALTEALAGLPGIDAQPVVFTPRASRHRGQRCRGVRLHIVDPARYAPIRTGLALAIALRDLHPRHWHHERLEQMLGHRAVYAAFREGAGLTALESLWADDLAQFAQLRQRYVRY